MRIRKAVVTGAVVAAALAGGAGIAFASTPTTGPAAVSSTADTPDAPGQVDTPEVGDTPDAPGQVDTPEAGDTPDAPGQVDAPEAGDTPDAPGQQG